jgi:hypothetical protein
MKSSMQLLLLLLLLLSRVQLAERMLLPQATAPPHQLAQ